MPAAISRYAIYLLLLCCTYRTHAQPQRGYLDVSVTPDRAGWTYSTGEPVQFNVSVLRAGYPIDGVSVRYEISPDVLEPTASGELELKSGRATLNAGTMNEPGFLRMQVWADYEGKTYQGMGTAGFSPEEIQPLTGMPADFEAYWDDAIAEARKTSLNPTMTLLPEYSTADVKVYHISFQNDSPRSKIYGMLSMPAAPGKYPVVLQVPGAGVRPYTPNTDAARRGVIHLTIGIHGIPVDMEQSVYGDLGGAALNGYWTYGIDDKDAYYYHRVVLGVVRAGDFLHSLPEADGEHYGVYGGSQGGALSIITAALDERIIRLSAMFPALSDHEAFMHGRSGGWPRILSSWYPQHQTDEIIENMRYYDVVNFARYVNVPGLYTWGYNDTVCPPTSMYAAYNVIPGEKTLWVVHETGHWTYPEQRERSLSSLIEAFTGQDVTSEAR